MTDKAGSLKDALAKDDAYRSFLNVIKTINARIDLKRDQEEIRLLADARTLPKMYGEPPTEMKLYNALAKEVANRARLTTLRCQLMIEDSFLKKLCEDMEAHLRTSYQDWLNEYGTRVDDHKQVIRKIMRKGNDLREAVRVTLDVIDYHIKDIDQAGYGATNMRIMFEKHTDPHNTPRYT